jgi:hypothetical protein
VTIATCRRLLARKEGTATCLGSNIIVIRAVSEPTSIASLLDAINLLLNRGTLSEQCLPTCAPLNGVSNAQQIIVDSRAIAKVTLSGSKATLEEAEAFSLWHVHLLCALFEHRSNISKEGFQTQARCRTIVPRE